MPRYAAHTAVGSDASRAEIERTLKRYGADQFMYGWGDGQSIGAWMRPQVEKAYRTGLMPSLLPTLLPAGDGRG